jgi:hypothetical protein
MPERGSSPLTAERWMYFRDRLKEHGNHICDANWIPPSHEEWATWLAMMDAKVAPIKDQDEQAKTEVIRAAKAEIARQVQRAWVVLCDCLCNTSGRVLDSIPSRDKVRIALDKLEHIVKS